MTIKKKTPKLSVKNIKVLSFIIQDKNYDKASKDVKFMLRHDLRFAVEENIISLKFLIIYSHASEANPFFSTEIENVFELTNLHLYAPKEKDVTPDNIQVPEDFLLKVVELSFSHSRALISQNIKGIIPLGLYLPVVDIRDLASHIFGETVISKKSKIK